MAYIEVVIKIPEEKYNYAKNQVAEGINNPWKVCIANGTPLPKGHGDLVDMNQLDSKMYHMTFETDTDLQKWDSGCWIRYKLYENIRDAMPVIIEADKVESEDV